MRVLQWCGTEHKFSPHFHIDFFIGVILQGRCDFEYEGNHLVADAGAISIIPPFSLHRAKCQLDTTYNAIYLSSDWLKRSVRDYQDGVAYCWVVDPVVYDQPLAQKLVQSLTRGDANATSNIAARILGKYARQVPVESSAIHWRSRASWLLRDSIMTRVKIADVAIAMGMSSQGFSRAFRRNFGVSPIFFRNQIRLAMAEDLLLLGSPLATVSSACGYSDQAHLSRALKSARGVTPRLYSHVYVPIQPVSKAGEDRVSLGVHACSDLRK